MTVKYPNVSQMARGCPRTAVTTVATVPIPTIEIDAVSLQHMDFLTLYT
ncbi:MAG: hypothetical protein V7751_22810 [Pseudoalteromonas distincta]